MKAVVRIVLFFLITGLGVLPGFSQQKVTLQDLNIYQPFTDYSTQRSGIKVQFDLKFDQYEPEFFNRSYDVYYKLQTWEGETVFDSRFQQKSTDRKVTARPDKPFTDPNATYMVDKDVKIFIPFQQIDLPTGEYDVKMVLSVEGKNVNMPDCAEIDVHFAHERFEVHTFEEQEFAFSSLTVTYDTKGFGTKHPGFDLDFELQVKHGPNETTDSDYTLTWEFVKLDGTVVYTSKEANSIHHQSELLRLKELDENDRKSINLFIDYADVELGGPETVEIRFYAKASSGAKRAIYQEKKALDLPQRYAFEQQVFTLTEVKVTPDTKDGVSGLTFTAAVAFTETGPRSDPERGAYFFYPMLVDASGRTVFDGRTADELPLGTTTAYYGIHPVDHPTGGDIRIFLPYRHLNLPEGEHSLDYRILVSDKYRKIDFPVLAQGDLTYTQPLTRNYRIDVREMQLVTSNYDTEINALGNKKPDPQWYLNVGNDTEFTSVRMKNSLSGPTGGTILRVAVGDALSLVLYDDDRGLFNRDDLLGSWALPLPTGDEVAELKLEESGFIERLVVEVKGR